jgi:hypothetical protein
MHNIKQLIFILCILLIWPCMTKGASIENVSKRFEGVFNIERAMHEIYGNSKLKKPDNPMAIVLNMEPIAHSDWLMAQHCSVTTLKKDNVLDDDRMKNLSSLITEYGPKANFEAFAYDALPFTVQGINKVFLVTQSSFCGANSCPAVIGVFLWVSSGSGWQLEKSSPCLLSMGGDSGLYYGNVSLLKMAGNEYGLKFQSRAGDRTFNQVVAVDKNGNLRVIRNDTVKGRKR